MQVVRRYSLLPFLSSSRQYKGIPVSPTPDERINTFCERPERAINSEFHLTIFTPMQRHYYQALPEEVLLSG